MIEVDEWAEIRRLHRAEGMGIKAIVRKLGVARNTVRAALRSDDAPKYSRDHPGSAVDAFEPAIRRLLATTPDMPATVVAERIGWTRGITVLRERVGELRVAYQVPEAFGRSEYKAGELAQWDLWFPDYDIPVGHGQTAVLPVLVGVACYSRWTLARMIGSKESADVLGGHLGLLVELGAVPRVGVYDGEPAISVRRGRRLIYTQDYLRLKGTLAMGSVVLAKGHPERKGGALDFIEAKSNAVFLGPPGTGKSHLSIALGIRACLAGHRVAFATAAQWVDRLGAAHDAGKLQDELRSLARVPLVIIDEVGYIPFQGEAANLFFQLVSSRYERASVIVSSNKAFSRWGEVFGDDTVAAAMIDRLVHHAEVINLKGDSYRLKGRDLGRVPGDDGA